MNRLIILVSALFMLSCSKDDETLPTPLNIVENEISVTTKIVKLDVENHVSFSQSSYSSNGRYITSYTQGQWYEYELKEGEFLSVSSSSQSNMGSPVIDVYVDSVLIHTEVGTNNGVVSYTYTNN